jgi:hypothetical protein
MLHNFFDKSSRKNGRTSKKGDYGKIILLHILHALPSVLIDDTTKTIDEYFKILDCLKSPEIGAKNK